jgi:hypothetical protein
MSFFRKVLTAGVLVAGLYAGGWWAKAAFNVALGLAAQKVQQSAIKRQERRNNRFKELEPPRGENRIPVIYGQAFTGGTLIDAKLSQDRRKLTLAIILSEKTGPKISDGLQSVFTCRWLLYNDQRVTLRPDGVTFQSLSNPQTGVTTNTIDGLIKVWIYDGGSTKNRRIGASAVVPTEPAWAIMPGWTEATHPMNELLFAIVQVEYNANRGVTQLEDLQFSIFNSMTLPGDVLHDYMTSERYGAGIKVGDINVQ